VPYDDGEIVWIECGQCFKCVNAIPRAETPLLVRLAAETLVDDA
jgi:hypothetical protein